MKNIRIQFIVLFFTALVFPHFGSSQDSSTNELSYNVYRNYPPLSITKEKLHEAHTLIDLNKNYESSWIKEYISVKLVTSYQGKIKKAMSKSITLSQEQKDNMKMADVGTDISVKVQYIPDNNLSYNDIKEIKFTFTVEPKNGAKYPGGQQQLKQYLKNNLIDKVADANLKQYQLAAITFTIDEEGHVIDPHVLWTSEDENELTPILRTT